MDQQFDPLTLIFLIIAAVIVFRIWSVLGTKSGNEHNRGSMMNPGQSSSVPQGAVGGDNVIPLPDSPHNQGQLHFDKEKEAQEEAIARYAKKGNGLEAGLRDIVKHDETFNPDHFVKGAKMAYEMIVEAFANGDRDTLKARLSPEVYESFSEALDQREKAGHKVETSFIGISKADIVEASMEGTMANVTMRFVSSAISVTRDEKGEIVSGDPGTVQESSDVWTFSRDTSSSDPNWFLVGTGGVA